MASGACAQSITVTPAAAAAAVPVNHPLALLGLAAGLALIASAWMQRGHDAVRSWCLTLGLTVSAASALWTAPVNAQLMELQRIFSRPEGETLSVPVQAGATAPDGTPLSFVPVVYTNQTRAALRVSNIALPRWDSCFAQGIPATLPAAVTRAGTPCAVGTTLVPGGQCWIDVARLCADAAAAAQGAHASVLQDDVATVVAGAQTQGNVLANDTDADGPLQVAQFSLETNTALAGATVTVAKRGTLTLQGTGAFTFTAAADFDGSNPVIIQYRTHTGQTATLRVTVTLPNRAPVANDDSASTTNDTAIVIAVRANDTDPDGHPLTVASVTQGSLGAVVIDAVTGNPIYTPSTGAVGVDHFFYTLSDGHGGQATAQVTVNVTSAVQPPTALGDTIYVVRGQSASVLLGGAGSVLTNDTDPAHLPLNAILVSGPNHGTLTLQSDGTFNYVHDGSNTQYDRFTYQANNGTQSSPAVDVAIGIAASAGAPVALDDHVTIQEDTALAVDWNLHALGNDISLAGGMRPISVGNATNGRLDMLGGVLYFTPAQDFNGTASFYYTMADNSGQVSGATVYITVTAVDDPTIARPDSLTTPMNQTGSFAVLSNDEDPDTGLSVTAFNVNGVDYNTPDTANMRGIGTLLVLSTGMGMFQPETGYTGNVPTVTYRTNTGATSTLSITVTP